MNSQVYGDKTQFEIEPETGKILDKVSEIQTEHGRKKKKMHRRGEVMYSSSRRRRVGGVSLLS